MVIHAEWLTAFSPYSFQRIKQKQASILLGIPALHSFLALLSALSYFSLTNSFSLTASRFCPQPNFSCPMLLRFLGGEI